MKTTAKPTPGLWTLGDENNRCAQVCLGDTDITFDICRESTYTAQMQISREEMLANVHLVMEAGTVYHETGLTPRQLLDQRNALWDALESIKSYPIAKTYPDGPCIEREDMAEIQAAIAKVMSEGRIDESESPRFQNVSCSNCGRSFGPGDHGFSHCENHEGRIPKP